MLNFKKLHTLAWSAALACLLSAGPANADRNGQETAAEMADVFGLDLNCENPQTDAEREECESLAEDATAEVPQSPAQVLIQELFERAGRVEQTGMNLPSVDEALAMARRDAVFAEASPEVFGETSDPTHAPGGCGTDEKFKKAWKAGIYQAFSGMRYSRAPRQMTRIQPFDRMEACHEFVPRGLAASQIPERVRDAAYCCRAGFERGIDAFRNSVMRGAINRDETAVGLLHECNQIFQNGIENGERSCREENCNLPYPGGREPGTVKALVGCYTLGYAQTASVCESTATLNIALQPDTMNTRLIRDRGTGVTEGVTYSGGRSPAAVSSGNEAAD